MAHFVNLSKSKAFNFGLLLKLRKRIMNFKKSTLAVIAAFLVSNILTTVWYMVSDDANFVSFRRPEVNYLGLIINHLIYAVVFVYLFSSFYEKAPKLSRAFLYGILMAAVMFIPSGIVVRSIWTVDFNSIFVFNSIAHLVIGGVMGIVVAFIYNYKRDS